jgi:hypothetical protein
MALAFAVQWQTESVELLFCDWGWRDSILLIHSKQQYQHQKRFPEMRVIQDIKATPTNE